MNNELSIDRLLSDIKKEAALLELDEPSLDQKTVLSRVVDVSHTKKELPIKRNYHKYDFMVFDDIDFVNNAYRGILQREPDEAGLDDYVASLRSGGSKEVILKALCQSEEAKKIGVFVGGFNDEVASTNELSRNRQETKNTYHIYDFVVYEREEFVKNAYDIILQRAVDEEGLISRVSQLDNGISKLEIILSLQRSAEGREKNIVIHGTAPHLPFYFLYRVPIIGRVLRGIVQRVKRNLWMPASESLPLFMKSHHPLWDKLEKMEHHIQQQSTLLNAQDGWIKNMCSEQRDVSVHLTTAIEQFNVEYAAFNQKTDSLLSATSESMGRSESQEKDLKLIRQDMLYHQQRLTSLLDELSANVAPQELAVSHQSDAVDAYYVAFEDECRGSRDEIKESLKVYLPHLGKSATDATVLDVGCGRGEWLDLLREHNFSGRGFDVNQVMVEQCREQGLDVKQCDAIAQLSTLDDGSLRGLTGFHIIEHITFVSLYTLFSEAARVLEQGGVMIFETPNPENLLVASHTFYHDPTHRNPITPTAIQFMARYFGFVDIEILRLHPYPQEAKVKGQDALTERINGHFCGPQDFAIIARKPMPAL